MVLPVRQIPNGDGSTQPCVCLFSALYAPSVGGVEGYTEHLAHALACIGCRVIVVAMNTHGREGYVHEPATPHKPEPTIADGDTPLVEVVRLPCRPLLGGRYPAPRRNAEFRALWKWLESQHINYVVVNTRFYLLSEMGVEFAQAKGIVPVVIEHGSAHLTIGNPMLDQAVQAVEHGLTKRLAAYPAAFYGVSKRACDWLGHFGITADGVLPNAIDTDTFAASAAAASLPPGNRSGSEEDETLSKPAASFRDRFGLPAEAFVVAFVGRLVPEKGIENLVEAVNLMEVDRPVTLLIAGDGPLRNDLARKAEAHNPEAAMTNDREGTPAQSPVCSPCEKPSEAGNEEHAVRQGSSAPFNRIILLGSLSKPQVADLLAQADVLCLPSRSEGFATVLLEASAAGTPCIATPVGGTDELFPTAGFGVVIPDAEPQTIAGALEAAAADPETWQAMGRHAAERVRSHFTWQTTAEALLTACRQINQR